MCGENKGGQLLCCAICHKTLHPECTALPEHVVHIALNYKWSCIDCKKCTVCEKPDNEAAMLFCDRCDRGYHTYCVGLLSPPSGTWICTNFCADHLEHLEET
ncbi:unnamed protein product [Gongylonema pulchrum]|uniref:PHD finger protein 10 n=1 Tax=Gongylonema pulchrum TaxID=637853 RepID=A0A183D2M8_9BILA|nr:unnamed protein product [Gongylonema pulchrum]